MEKEDIKKIVEAIFNRDDNWYFTARNGYQLDVQKTMDGIVEWVSGIASSRAAHERASAIAFAEWMLKKRCECARDWWNVGHQDFKKDFYSSEELHEAFEIERKK